MTAPLSGKTVALLRAKGRGGELEAGLRALGADVLEVPLLAFAPPEDPAPLEDAVRTVGRFDWIAFTSPTAVTAFLERMEEPGLLRTIPLASVGPGTSAKLRELGLEVALEAGRSLQEGLAEALVARGVRGKRILIPRSDLARDALERALVDAGAEVTAVCAYRTVEGDGDARALEDALAKGRVHAVCFTSSSTVEHLVRRIGADAVRRLFAPGGPVAASMGPITSAPLRALGVSPVEAREHVARGLVETVRDALAEGHGT